MAPRKRTIKDVFQSLPTKSVLLSTSAIPRNFTPQSIAPITVDPTAPVEAQKKALDALIASKPLGSIVVTFTPELAAYALTLNFPRNRAKKPTRIKQYADSMARREWRLNGETVKFADDGYLHDGQNRMMSSVRSGAPFTTHVVFGVPADSFDTIDTGKSRDGGDLLTSAGYTNTLKRAAGLKWLMVFEGANIANRSAAFTAQEILNRQRRLDADGEDGAFNDALSYAVCIYNKRKVLVTSSMTALLYLYGRYTPYMIPAIVRDADLDRGNMRRLRLLLESLSSRAYRSIDDAIRNAFIIIVFNAYCTQKRLTRTDLEWSSTDPYPVPVWKSAIWKPAQP